VQEINIKIHTTASDHSYAESVPMINKHSMKIQHLSSTNRFIEQMHYCSVHATSCLVYTLNTHDHNSIKNFSDLKY